MPLSKSVSGRLKNQQESLDELLNGLTDEQLKEPVNPGKWSAFENLVHLTAYQPMFLKRLQLIAQQENPLFERYSADNDPVFHQYLGRSVQDLLEEYATRRFLINDHIIQLTEAQLQRRGTHPAYGSFTIGQWADFYLLHEAHHLFTIFMLTSALRKRIQ